MVANLSRPLAQPSVGSIAIASRVGPGPSEFMHGRVTVATLNGLAAREDGRGTRRLAPECGRGLGNPGRYAIVGA